MTSVDALLSPGTLFQGRFLLERPLGRGGMGEVWAALDTALERPVAIKIVHRALAGDTRYAERFLRETKLIARVAHPGIVRLYDAGTAADGRLFMVMERVFGVPLRQRMIGGARLDPARAVRVAIQIADALAAAHEAELVHRDVKPENILVSEGAREGVRAQLLDFGLAKDGRGLGLTRQGAAVGTARYMAPEQITGSADARADLYALGVVVYEMLAGAHPYPILDLASGVGETEILAAHVHLDARPLPEALPACSDALWRAVARCLAKRPEERFQRAVELAQALRDATRTSVAPDRPSVRQIVADPAGARAPTALASSPQGETTDRVRSSTAPLPPGFVPPSPMGSNAPARSKLAMAQTFEVAPALRRAITASDGEAPGGPAARPATERGQAAGRSAEGGARASALASTERWDGAPQVMAAGPLARTEPWEAPRDARIAAARREPAQARWALVLVAAAAVALVTALLAAR